MKRATGFTLLAAMLISWGGASLAKDDTRQARMLEDLAACHAITDASERFACLERTSLRLLDAAKTKELLVLDRTDVETTKRSLFGFTLPKLPIFGGRPGDKETDVSQIETTITHVRGLGYGKWAIKTAEGATWHTTEALSDPPAAGQAMTIRSAALGGYFLKVGKEKAVRAMRVN